MAQIFHGRLIVCIGPKQADQLASCGTALDNQVIQQGVSPFVGQAQCPSVCCDLWGAKQLCVQLRHIEAAFPVWSQF